MKVDIGELPGTPLHQEDFDEKRVLTTYWRPNASYVWDAGIAVGRFLEGLQEGRIIGSRCLECGRTVVPPRVYCEWCFGSMDDWVALEDTGTVNTFSRCYVSWDVKMLDDPQLPAVIEIDGASEGIGFMHLLGEVDPDAVEIGMPVEAVWKPAEERIGSITDIEYFRPR